MGIDQVVKFSIEIWLFAVVLLLGVGPGTAWLRRWTLPAYYWLPLTFVSACVVAYALFWIFLFDARAGRVAAIVCWSASVGAFGWQIWRTRRSAAPVSAMLAERDAWLPGVLMLVLSMAYLFVLFARDAPVNNRFTWMLPQDNIIPLLFANWIDDVTVRAQPFLHGRWLTSDRPPLQAAMVLATRPWASGGSYANLAYQVVATTCELGWVPVLYALLRQLGATRRQQVYAFLGCACSGFFLLNSVYTWPKLLAAWLFVFAVALLIRLTIPRHARDAPRLVPLVGVLLALSLLSHGGTAFSLLALPVLWTSRRLRAVVTLRHAALIGLVLIGVMSPWLAYQRFYDPPGNRLLKEHLAGLVEPDSRGLRAAIVDQYATLTPATYLAGRWANVRTQGMWDPRDVSETFTDWLRRQQFFHHLIALDVLCLGFVGLWLRRSAPAPAPAPAPALASRSAWPLASQPASSSIDDARHPLRGLVIFALATIAVWCLLMFTPGATIVHQGSYAATMLLFVGAAVGVASLPRPIGAAAIGAHVLLFAALWLVTAQTSLPGGPAPWKPAQAAGAALFFVVFGAALRAIPDTPSSRSAATA